MRISQQGNNACMVLAAVLLMMGGPTTGAPSMLRRLRRHTNEDAGDGDLNAYDGDNSYDASHQRQEKQLPYFSYYPQLPPGGLPPPPQFYYSGYQEGDDNEVLSRAEPTSVRKPSGYPDSPVYYIRMPPTPYVFVPGIGYVSQPPAPPPAFSPFINLPVDFVANGKPTSVYWRPTTRPPQPPPPQAPVPGTGMGGGSGGAGAGGQRPVRPQADSPVTQLDQGPYVFNGRPTDLFLLRNTYNSLYNDALQNIYP